MKRSWQSRVLNLLLRVFVRSTARTDLDPAAVRQRTLKLLNRFGRNAQAASSEITQQSVQMGSVQAKQFINSNADGNKVILYLHGGGFYMPALKPHFEFVTDLCHSLNANAFIPDYGLFPENPFPAAPDDCLASYQWLLEQGHAPKDVVIAGDSAGGNLCLTTLMSARDQGLPMPSCTVMLSPATDTQFRGSAIYKNARRDPLFKVPLLFWMREHYVGTANLWQPKASPLEGDFQGLPPLMFHVGSTELLLDGSVLAHQKAKKQGAESHLKVWDYMPHVFPLVAFLPEAKQARSEIVDFIRLKWSEGDFL